MSVSSSVGGVLVDKAADITVLASMCPVIKLEPLYLYLDNNFAPDKMAYLGEEWSLMTYYRLAWYMVNCTIFASVICAAKVVRPVLKN